MKRGKLVLALMVLAALLVGAFGPAAYAETRHVDVTAKVEPADFFNYSFVQGYPYDDIVNLNKVTVAVTVGGAKLKETVLDKNNTSFLFDFDVTRSGDIKVVVVYNYDKKPDKTFELPYTKAGQTVVIAYHNPVDEIKTLKLP